MNGIKPLEETLTAPDRTKIFLRRWPVADPKAVLVICHGLGEHGGRYGNLVNVLVPAGYACFAHDHRGHGRTEGKRGHVDRFDQFLDDVHLVVTNARDAYPGKKVFLFGHSMGGLIALSYALHRPHAVDGVIASGAALRLQVEVPKVKATFGRLVASLAPTLALGNGLDPKWLSHDPAVVQAYLEDPLVHDRVTAKFFVEFTAAMRRALFAAGALQMPALIYHGGDDPICAPQGSADFYERAASPDKTFRVFEGQFHETHNDTAKEQAVDMIREWLDKHAAV
jgi:alpha-beta hydrolase superfamily lysophospholipase